MQCEYLMGTILQVTANTREFNIRLDLDDSETPTESGNPVITLCLKNCSQSQAAYAMLIQHQFDWAVVVFKEDDLGKHLEIQLDDSSDIGLTLDYSECNMSEESYTVDDLNAKLKYLKETHASEMNHYHQMTTRHWKLRNALRGELYKELDRFERKSDFFSGTERGDRFEIGRKCYQKMLDLFERLEKTGEV
jgi:hypothetical protein